MAIFSADSTSEFSLSFIFLFVTDLCAEVLKVKSILPVLDWFGTKEKKTVVRQVHYLMCLIIMRDIFRKHNLRKLQKYKNRYSNS